MKTQHHIPHHIQQIRRVVLVFIIFLIISGVTAFPLVTEVNWMMQHLTLFPIYFHSWIKAVYGAVISTPSIVLYGTDWLAFAHIIISLFFIGVYINPIKNKFIIDVGIIACLGVFPLAFICGPIRHIPFYHQLIDCCFGLLGLLPLLYIKAKIKLLENNSSINKEN